MTIDETNCGEPDSDWVRWDYWLPKRDRYAEMAAFRRLPSKVRDALGEMCLADGLDSYGLLLSEAVASVSRHLPPDRCGRCADSPPAGFTCNTCGAVGKEETA